MKILIRKTSDYFYREVREYESLEECVDKLLGDEEQFRTNMPEVIVGRINEYLKPEYEDCTYQVEIYDDYRE